MSDMETKTDAVEVKSKRERPPQGPTSATPAPRIVLQPECRIISYNVSKKQNVGTIVRSGVAFGASQLIIVGKRKINTFGNKNTNRYMQFVHFDTLDDARASLKAEGFTIYGVEISAKAHSIASHPFKGKSAFIFGNEGQGLNEKAVAFCDELVYIPQHGMGTASLNVSVAAGIVLHHFATWAKYPEQSREGEKYVVDLSQATDNGSGRASSSASTDPSESSAVKKLKTESSSSAPLESAPLDPA